MHRIIFFLLIIFSPSVFSQTPVKVSSVTGMVFRYGNFPSRNTDARNIDVWLPPGYVNNTNQRYAVLYVHDGQNLFDSKDSMSRVEWGLDEMMTRLTNENRIRKTIVVAIWTTPRRMHEFMPQKSFDKAVVYSKSKRRRSVYTNSGSDDYLRFIVRELKPFIDERYRTLPGRENTFIMGSSMGGLMSLYAISEYPKTFGGAACLSTQFALAKGVILRYMEKRLAPPKNHKIYFDVGTKTLDKDNAPYQLRADAIMRRKGYQESVNWITRTFAGEEHSERAWRKRVDIPLVFLLGK
jgi:predicted alpha/beta superfamily hydrolase